MIGPQAPAQVFVPDVRMILPLPAGEGEGERFVDSATSQKMGGFRLGPFRASSLAATARIHFDDGMKPVLPRRQFLKRTSAAASFAAFGGFNLLRAGESPARKLVLGIMGCNGRGMDHIAGHLAVPNVEIGYVCDVDRRAVEKGIAAVAKK